jgi:hypothetical protein
MKGTKMTALIPQQGTGPGEEIVASAELYAAVLSDDYCKIIGCAEGGEDVRGLDPHFGVAMPFWAVERGRARTLQVLITLGADKDCRGFNGDRPIHSSARRGDIASTAVLLITGADLRAVNADLDTALHLSTYFGHEALTYILLACGADTTATNKAGLRPAEVAAINGDTALEFLHAWHQTCSSQSAGAQNLRRRAESTLPFTLLKRRLNLYGMTASPEVDRNRLHALTRLPKAAHASGVLAPHTLTDRHPTHTHTTFVTSHVM